MFAGLLSLGSAAAAFDDQAHGAYVEAGATPRADTTAEAVALGFVAPWAHGPSVQGGPLSFYWDFFLSEWRARQPSGRDQRNYTQIGAGANGRYRFGAGASPWFVEAGLAATLLDRLYHTPDREFSTAFQFVSQLGVGRDFGSQGQNEWSLRIQHVSNADIKHPNPGLNFLRLRYLYRF